MNNIHYFFRTVEGVNNFKTLGITHIILLSIIILGAFFIKKMKRENRAFELLLGFTLIIQQATLYLWYFLGDYKFLSEGLPLFHCRIAIILVSIGLIFKKNFMMKMGSYWGIAGSILALLFVNLDSFTFPHITQFSYFIGHIFLFWGCVYILNIKKLGMSKTDFYKAFIVTNLYHIIISKINYLINSNYAYMKSSPIEIGIKLNPILYGFIVMMIFNLVLLIEFIILNKKKECKAEECCELELI